MTKTELFIQLAKPDENGISRWVSVTEFVGEYACLTFGNGASWARKESTLAKKYVIEFDKSISSGNSIAHYFLIKQCRHSNVLSAFASLALSALNRLCSCISRLYLPYLPIIFSIV